MQEIQDKRYPQLAEPKGRTIEHSIILKIVTTNICGSDLHIYHGRFAAPAGNGDESREHWRGRLGRRACQAYQERR